MIFKPSVSRLAGIPLEASDIQFLPDARSYKESLLNEIANATQRIYITALYLQDDEAGQDVVNALAAAKKRLPSLDIRVFVDFHRAQRGLIGEKESLGNRSLYLKIETDFEVEIPVYGVPVKRKELFGVLHLKGMIFDNTVLYTGASINNVYCWQEEQYRIDRYQVIRSEGLANAMVDFLYSTFIAEQGGLRLDKPGSFDKKTILKRVQGLKKKLAGNRYQVGKVQATELSVLPIVGLGKKKNQLNDVIRQVIKASQHSLVIFTPYFNMPKVLKRELVKALKRGVQVEIVVGDKTANDFYLSPDKPFTTIGIIPYLYEQMLKQFIKQYQKYIDKGLLSINLWQHGNNSFHLKGITADNQTYVLTGNNLNPRAWALDLENGLIIRDENQHLLPMWQEELAKIKQHTNEIVTHRIIPMVSDYPLKPRRLFRRLRLSQINRLLRRLL